MAEATLKKSAPKRMTTAELLAFPEDGVERWLINGQLREKQPRDWGMTRRNRFHSRATSRISYLLETWLEQQPLPRGEVLSGEAGVILQHDPDTTAGIDVVYISAEVVAKQDDETTLVDGTPTLVVEVLSPNDTQEEIDEKIDKYLETGVPIIWIVDPHDKTVLVHRPDALPQLFNVEQELTAEPHLPGFRIGVAKIFN